MQYRSFLILYCLAQLKGERTVYGIYHLLKGKKSSQTIQDAKLYDLAFLFQAFPTITRNELLGIVKGLAEEQYIKEINVDSFILTEAGQLTLKKYIETKPFPVHLNGWEYGTVAFTFWKRLVLVVQTLSHLLKGNHSFIPVTRDKLVLDWVKHYLLTLTVSKRAISYSVFKECQVILKQLNQVDADIFTLKLSGSHRIGYTNKQIAEMMNMDEVEIQLHFLNVLHYVVKVIQMDFNRFPVLNEFIKDLNTSYPFTISTQKTYELLISQKSIDEIASVRGLKKSTVEDHIVEIVLHDPTFNIHPFVSKNVQGKIMEKAKEIGVKRMKPIKEELEDSVSYFQIRLVLAKAGEQ